MIACSLTLVMSIFSQNSSTGAPLEVEACPLIHWYCLDQAQAHDMCMPKVKHSLKNLHKDANATLCFGSYI